MKILISLLVLMVTANDCSQKQKEEKMTQQEVTKELGQDIKSISYEAASRGYFYSVSMSAATGELNVREAREGKAQSISLTDQQQKEIFKAANDIDIKNIAQLEAPSTAHQYDGAPGASLKITTKEGSFTSATFDDGNPPNELKTLVSKLMTIADRK